MMVPIRWIVLAALLGRGSVIAAQEVAGIGVALAQDQDRIVVQKIAPDGVAARSNALHEKDRVIAVAQGDEAPVSVTGTELGKVVQMIRGPKGTTVRLTIAKEGEADARARVVSFVRGELKELARWGDGREMPAGTVAPDIRFVTLPEAKPGRLADSRGKVVVLEFWATWCGPCQKGMEELQGYRARHPAWGDDVVLLTANVDERKEVATKHLKEKGWDRTLNVWVEPEAIKAYHVNAIPMVFVVGKDGKVVVSGHDVAIAETVTRLLESKP